MNVVIVGCGRVGSSLAGFLLDRGDCVTVVDRNLKAFRRLEDEEHEGPGRQGAGPGNDRTMTTKRGFRCVLGVGIDEDVLRSAGIAQAEAFAAVTDNDYANIMGGLMAREIFRVPRVIARLTDTRWAGVCHDMGIETICPPVLGAQSILNQLIPWGEGR